MNLLKEFKTDLCKTKVFYYSTDNAIIWEDIKERQRGFDELIQHDFVVGRGDKYILTTDENYFNDMRVDFYKYNFIVPAMENNYEQILSRVCNWFVHNVDRIVGIKSENLSVCITTEYVYRDYVVIVPNPIDNDLFDDLNEVVCGRKLY